MRVDGDALESLEDPGELLLFDLYDSVYYHPSERTESVLLQERPEWEAQVLPLVKARGYALLLSKEWHIMKYEDKVFRFEPLMDKPEKPQDLHCLLSTDSLPFMSKQTILELIRPASYANQLSMRLSDKLKRDVDLGRPSDLQEVCDSMERLVLSLNEEVEKWKDRFFYDAMEADEDEVLCEDCKEEMRVAFYESSREKALQWRPERDKPCKWFKMYSMEA